MRKLAVLTTIPMLTALSLGLSSSQALAGATAAGTTCENVSSSAVLEYQTTAVAVNGAGNIITCPITVDHTLGTTVTFRVWMGDGSTTANWTCNGYIHGAGGVQLAVSPSITSASCAAAPATCMGEASASVATTNPSYIYTVQCVSPGANIGYSSIESVRVY
jgi:hypothetical protein